MYIRKCIYIYARIICLYLDSHILYRFHLGNQKIQFPPCMVVGGLFG